MFLKAIRKWDKGLVDSHSDLLALASFTAAAEKANQIMAAGSIVQSCLFLELLINTSFQAKMWYLTSQPPWPQAETKWPVFSPTLWLLSTGGRAPAELLLTKKLSDTIALHFWPIQDILSLKTWPTDPVEMFLLYKLLPTEMLPSLFLLKVVNKIFVIML